MKYFQSTIERTLYFLVVVVVALMVGVGLLMYDVITKQNHEIAEQDQTIAELKTVVNNQTGTIDSMNKGFSSLNSKVDCIFQYFATPNRNSNTTITLTPNEKICDVNVNPVASTPVGSAGSTKSGGVSNASPSTTTTPTKTTPPTVAPPSTPPTITPVTPVTPVFTFVCNLTLQLLCLQ